MLRRSMLRREAIGFIGLGQMGARMAPNVLKLGADTTLEVFDVNPKALELIPFPPTVDASRAHMCASPAEVAAKCRRIITMLPNGAIVEEVFGNKSTGLWRTIQPGTIVCDSSTVDPDTPKRLAEVGKSKGVTIVDAPVSGGVNAAAAGTLTFMVGAESADAFKLAEALLKPMAKSIVHCGPVGSGQVCKLCNNLILAQHMISVSEAMLMGAKLGVDPKTLAGIVNTSTGRCWSSELYNPYPGVVANVPSSNSYKGGFGAKLMLKDLGLAIDAAKTAGVEVRGAQNAKQMYSEMAATGALGDLDFSGIIKLIEGRSTK